MKRFTGKVGMRCIAILIALISLGSAVHAGKIYSKLDGVPSYGDWGDWFGPGDIDGDSDFDFIFRWLGGDEVADKIVCYENNGTGKLSHNWTFQLTSKPDDVYIAPFIPFDVDGDGKDEIYAIDNNVNDSNRREIIKINGETGQIIKRKPLDKGAAEKKWGWRVKLGIAWLDGSNPNLVVIVGGLLSKPEMIMLAYDGDLTLTNSVHCVDMSDDYAGAVGHNFTCADVDDDGKDEVLVGSAMFDHDFSKMWSLFAGDYGNAGYGDTRHTDVNFLADIREDIPGLEVLVGGESRVFFGLLKAKTGEVIWSKPYSNVQGKGFVGDITDDHEGMEVYFKLHGHENTPDLLWSSKGYEIDKSKYGLANPPGERTGSVLNWAIWWKGTKLMQIVAHDGPPRIATRPPSNNYAADIMGDWREEYCYSEGNGNFYINTPDGEPEIQRPSMRNDRKYRAEMAKGLRATGYMSRPMPSKWAWDDATVVSENPAVKKASQPAKSILANLPQQSAVQMYDMSGRMISTNNAKALLNNNSAIPKGTYILRVVDNDGTQPNGLLKVVW